MLSNFATLLDMRFDYDNHPRKKCLTVPEAYEFSFGIAIRPRQIASHLNNCELCHYMISVIIDHFHPSLKELASFSLKKRGLNYIHQISDEAFQDVGNHFKHCLICRQTVEFLEQKEPDFLFGLKHGVRSTTVTTQKHVERLLADPYRNIYQILSSTTAMIEHTHTFVLTELEATTNNI